MIKPPLPKAIGRSLNLAFELRQKADYREFFSPTREQSEQVIGWAAEFISEIQRLVNADGPPPAPSD